MRMNSVRRVIRLERLDALTLRLSLIAALAVVLALDAVVNEDWPLLLVGLLDEIGHLATAWVLLVALLPDRYRPLAPWALLGAVLIDVDHIPLYLWDVAATHPQGRPITHSLTFVLVLLALSRLDRRLRTPLSGLALGVFLHLLRDIVTGPGASLFWPIAETSVLVPYSLYVVLLCVAAAWAVLRSGRQQPPAAGSPPLT
jgi:inner membrane protein